MGPAYTSYTGGRDTSLLRREVELPRFDGSNPRLWQDRCEDYFQVWATPENKWIQFAFARFDGAAARWLESAWHRIPTATWSEFCQHLHTRFGQNQHRSLVRKLIQIRQISTVVDYVERFSELYDQLAAYEVCPDSVHYTTRFIEGLKPTIRVAVAIQQPVDLDKAVEVSMLFEELEEEPQFDSAPSSPMYYQPGGQHQPSYHTRPVVARAPVDKPALARTPTVEDKWTQLRNFRKAKGLCFTCGESWSKEHQCKRSVQLHVVQEMLDFLQVEEQPYYECEAAEAAPNGQLMQISAAARGHKEVEQTMQLSIVIQGCPLTVLVYSGSTHPFLNHELLSKFSGVTSMQSVQVKVADVGLLQCDSQIGDCPWSVDGNGFTTTFRFLPLGTYDAILELDWLVKHSPMEVDWAQKWMKIPGDSGRVTLQGQCQGEVPFTLFELSAILTENAPPVHPEIQQILDEFSLVFEQPTGLPPSRRCDHHIPLVPAARTITIRSYRVVTELKYKIEKQVAEMLK